MSRIETRFSGLRAKGRRALIPYIMAGDPTVATTVPLMHALVAAGADLIELGVPFSDPMADGPVIQAAGERSLANGVHLTSVLDMISTFRRDDPQTPIILMGYLNPIEALGYQRFAAAAAAAGADGCLTVDLPPEEATELVGALESKGLDPIFLTAPTTTPGRLQRIAAMGRGFVYYVSLKGVTGSSRLDTASVESRIAELREHTGLPLAVGFGISTPEMAVQVARYADAVVVGSSLVKHMAAHAGDASALTAAVSTLLTDMRQAMDRNGASVG